jgi:HEAT repeat protein
MRVTYSVRIACLAAAGCLVAVSGCAKEKQPQAEEQVARNLSKWTEALKSSDAKVRIDALNHLGNAGHASPDSTFPLVAAALKDADPGVRKEAIRNMWKFDKKPTEAIAALTEVKEKDDDAGIRKNAQEMIQAIQGRQAKPK